jgi:hypothetical protein
VPTSTKKTSPQAIESALASLPGAADRAGMPAKDSIVAISMPTAPMAAAAAAGVPQYAFIYTNEMDEYGEDEAAATLTAANAALPPGDDFQGTSRKKAKLSISTAKTEKFKDVRSLINSLAPEDAMKKHKPKIGTGATSNRVKEEERNVHVKAFMYAASREADNDFHLIIGRDPKATPETYMTMELSGLPPSNSPPFAQLNAARDAFKKFFSDNGGTLPGAGYVFPHPPVPVLIDGSLFFDITHATGSRPGPKSLKSRMPVIWEVHPITKMVLK